MRWPWMGLSSHSHEFLNIDPASLIWKWLPVLKILPENYGMFKSARANRNSVNYLLKIHGLWTQYFSRVCTITPAHFHWRHFLMKSFHGNFLLLSNGGSSTDGSWPLARATTFKWTNQNVDWKNIQWPKLIYRNIRPCRQMSKATNLIVSGKWDVKKDWDRLQQHARP